MFRMKFIIALCIAAMAAPSPASVVSDEGSSSPRIIKLGPNDNGGSGRRVILVNREPTKDEAAADADAKLKAEQEAQAARDIEAGGPWIGVQFGPLSKPLASHLKLEQNAGQMVLNVAEGSPADVAGLQQYDVLTTVDGKAVSGRLDEFLDTVRGFAPNERHEFGLIRAGSPLTVGVTVGARPEDWSALKYKYELEEEPLLGGQVFRRGGILERDPQGAWSFKDLDELNDLHEIWKNFPQFDPEDLQFSWRGSAPGNHQQMQVFVDRGREVRIERDAAGKITVTKTEKENGEEKTTTQTYDNEDAFKAGDPDTYKSYNGGLGVDENAFQYYSNPFSRSGGRVWRGQSPMQMHPPFDMKELHEAAEALRKQAEDAQLRSEAIRQHLESTLKQKSDEAAALAHEAAAGKQAPAVIPAAKTSFEIDSDGTVKATSRSADTEIVERFQSVDAMKAARPDLFEKYQAARGDAE